MAVGLTTSILNTYMGKGIKDICPYDYEKDGDSHCAHFVGHILQLTIGETCAMQTVTLALRKKYSIDRASIRVHEIFNDVGGGVKIDVAAATAASATTAPVLTTTSSGGVAAVSTSSGAFVVPTLTMTSGAGIALSTAPSGVPPAECLIYALLGDRVKGSVMESQRYEHIGIYFDGLVWNYSNTQHKVVTKTLTEFSSHYGAGKTVLYYTDFPAGATAVEFATASASALPANSYTLGTGSNGHPEFRINNKYKPAATPAPTPSPTASPFASPTPTPTASPFATPAPFATPTSTPGVKR